MRKYLAILFSALLLCSCSSMLRSGVSDSATQMFTSYKAKDSNFSAADIYWLIRMAIGSKAKQAEAGFDEVKGMWMVSWEKCPQSVQDAFLSDCDRLLSGKTKTVDRSEKGVYTMYYTPVPGSDKAKDIWLFFKRDTPLEDGTRTNLMYIPGRITLDSAKELSSSDTSKKKSKEKAK